VPLERLLLFRFEQAVSEERSIEINPELQAISRLLPWFTLCHHETTTPATWRALLRVHGRYGKETTFRIVSNKSKPKSIIQFRAVPPSDPVAG